MAKFLTLDDIDPSGKTVLLRADLNVPVQDGRVTDATRIERLVPTIRELADKGARIVVMSHFGRPKGASTRRCRCASWRRARAASAPQVAFAEDCIGPEPKRCRRAGARRGRAAREFALP